VGDLEEKNRQQTRKYCLLQKEFVELREANKVQKEEIGTIRSAQANSDKEMTELRAEFVREQEATNGRLRHLGGGWTRKPRPAGNLRRSS
jgi:FtsZ-binding cell division protein ZapB